MRIGAWGMNVLGINAGIIGIAYENTFGCILAWITTIIIGILAIIGLLAVIGFIRKSRKPKETPGQKWLRTGKMD